MQPREDAQALQEEAGSPEAEQRFAAEQEGAQEQEQAQERAPRARRERRDNRDRRGRAKREKFDGTPVLPHETINYTEEAAEGNAAADFLKGLLKAMGVEATVLANVSEEGIRLRIDSASMGILIGHRVKRSMPSSI